MVVLHPLHFDWMAEKKVIMMIAAFSFTSFRSWQVIRKHSERKNKHAKPKSLTVNMHKVKFVT